MDTVGTPAFAPAGTPSLGRARIHVQHQFEGQWFGVWMDFLGFWSPSAGRGRSGGFALALPSRCWARSEATRPRCPLSLPPWRFLTFGILVGLHMGKELLSWSLSPSWCPEAADLGTDASASRSKCHRCRSLQPGGVLGVAQLDPPGLCWAPLEPGQRGQEGSVLHRAAVNPPVPFPSPGSFQGLVPLPPGAAGMDWDVISPL